MSNRTQTIEVEVLIQRGKPGTRGRKGSNGNVPSPRVPRISRLMALAIKFQSMTDRGEVRDYADLARLGFVTRARLTQIMNLLLLAPDIQEHLLSLASAGAVRETQLRSVAGIVEWREQRQCFESIAGFASKT